MLAAVGTALTSAVAGCSSLNPFSGESNIEYDESAIAALPDDIPQVPPTTPLQPTTAHLTSARDRIRSLLVNVDLSQIPNEIVRKKLAHERDSAHGALTQAETIGSRVDALARLTHPRSEAMFVNAGFAAFNDTLTPADIVARRKRHRQDAESFLEDYTYVGPADDPVAAFAEHAQITD